MNCPHCNEKIDKVVIMFLTQLSLDEDGLINRLETKELMQNTMLKFIHEKCDGEITDILNIGFGTLINSDIEMDSDLPNIRNININ